MKLVSSRQMKQLDRRTIEQDNVPEDLLMRRAGAALAAAACRLLPNGGHVAVLAGRGNNGGDAQIAAKLLKSRKYKVHLLTPDPDAPAAAVADFRSTLASSDLVIDGLLGTGLSRPVRGAFKAIIEGLNESKERRPSLKVLAVDVPSGLSADTGRPMGVAVRADLTVSFGLPKIGLAAESAMDYVGHLEVADIGYAVARVAEIRATAEWITAVDLAGRVRPRRRAAFKNDFGHALVIAGSEGLHGAAWMTAHGALAAGAGLVTLTVPRSIYAPVAAQCRQVMVVPVHDHEGAFGRASLVRALALLPRKDAIVIGPGLGTSRGTLEFLSGLFAQIRVPCVLDADALNLVAANPRLWARLKAPVVLTPHPGEMARLSGATSAAVQADRLKAVSREARKRKCVVVLKGARTAVSDGTTPWVNSTGNPSLAVGGTGDVLAGLIGGLIAQERRPIDAARIGVYVQGLAADLAAPALPVAGIKVEELLHEIPVAMSTLVH